MGWEKQLSEITIDTLINNGLATLKDKVKVLGRGELSIKVNVSANAFSMSAKKAIEEKGGIVTII